MLFRVVVHKDLKLDDVFGRIMWLEVRSLLSTADWWG